MNTREHTHTHASTRTHAPMHTQQKQVAQKSGFHICRPTQQPTAFLVSIESINTHAVVEEHSPLAS